MTHWHKYPGAEIYERQTKPTQGSLPQGIRVVIFSGGRYVASMAMRLGEADTIEAAQALADAYPMPGEDPNVLH